MYLYTQIADAYLNAELGSGYEWWKNFYEFHKLAIDELEAFDYGEYKKNGYKVNKLGDYDSAEDKIPEQSPGKLFESPCILNDTWRYKSFDNNRKSTEQIVKTKKHLNDLVMNFNFFV